MSVAYIAGPMRGLPDLGRANFRHAEVQLREAGWKVINPAILPTDLPDDAYMPICLSMLDQADTVFMLPDWQKSIGANIEHAYAVSRVKKIVYMEVSVCATSKG